MDDVINKMQLVAIEWIAQNHLEAEFNKYALNPDMRYVAIGFAINYCEKNPDKIKIWEGVK